MGARARPALSLKGRALRYLSQREHSRAELERKLAPHVPEGQDEGELAKVLDELERRGFIDPARVADSVVHRRAGKLGALRIRQELQAKGLDPGLVQQAVAGLKATELARAREVWRRKFDALPADANERARQMRFLLARGFESGVVRALLAGDMDELQ